MLLSWPRSLQSFVTSCWKMDSRKSTIRPSVRLALSSATSFTASFDVADRRFRNRCFSLAREIHDYPAGWRTSLGLGAWCSHYFHQVQADWSTHAHPEVSCSICNAILSSGCNREAFQCSRRLERETHPGIMGCCQWREDGLSAPTCCSPSRTRCAASGTP